MTNEFSERKEEEAVQDKNLMLDLRTGELVFLRWFSSPFSCQFGAQPIYVETHREPAPVQLYDAAVEYYELVEPQLGNTNQREEAQ